MPEKITFKVPTGFQRRFIGDVRPQIYWGWNVTQKLWIKGVYPGKVINEKTAPVIAPIDGLSQIDPNSLTSTDFNA
ncbi:MAG: hypothetical protein WCH84_08205 [Verrucomicrobiota bacterium]